MSRWNHSICLQCWKKIFLERHPIKVKDSITEHCCYCGEKTNEGIYMREDGVKLLCKGNCN